LQRFVQRWGVYGGVLVAVVVGTAGSVADGALVFAGVVAWTVLPLWHALAVTPWTWGLVALGLQAAIGIGLLRAMRPLLWPMAWRDSENALPLARSETLRSDVVVCSVALLPWWLLQALGGVAVWSQSPAWQVPVRWPLAAALGLVQLAALAGGVRGLQQARSVPGLNRRRGDGAGAAVEARRWARPITRIPWPSALLLRPLWRGPAERLGRLLTGGTLALGLFTAAMVWRPAWAPWWLAAWSVCALVLVARLNTLSLQSLAPLLQAAADTLPLSAASLERARRVLVLSAAGLSAITLLAGLCWGLPPGALRPAVLVAWCAVAAALLWWGTGPARAPSDAQATASAWLLGLVLMLALSSEILTQ